MVLHIVLTVLIFSIFDGFMSSPLWFTWVFVSTFYLCGELSMDQAAVAISNMRSLQRI